jgi:protein disulfide-isomerase-like protein
LTDSTVAAKDNIVRLTKFNFDSNVQQGSWFVKFYAPWCTHCIRLAPIWEKLADQAAEKDWPVKIAEVDCTSSKGVCEKAQVKAFPMLALIHNGVVKGKYQGEASVALFEQWLNKQQALQAQSSSRGTGPTVLTSEGKNDGSNPTASPFTAATAVISNFVARFPTDSQILNIYIHGGIGLAILVAILYGLFSFVEDAGEDHDKEN